jgi:cytochrome c556
MKKTFFASIAMVVATLCLPFAAQAQFAKAEDAETYRQSAFKLMGSHFGRMQPVMKGQVPYDKAAIAANIAVLNEISKLPWAAFGAGAEGGQAKVEIWLDPEDFKKAQEKLTISLKALTSASDAGNFDNLRVAYGQVGASCKACHDAFRAKAEQAHKPN